MLRTGHRASGIRTRPARRRWEAAVLGVVLIAGGALGSSAPAATDLLGVRTSSEADHFRLVIDLSRRVAPEERLFRDPFRIAINLADTDAGAVALPRVQDWMVKRVRLNRLRSGTAQVVLDVSHEPSFSVFTVPARDGKPFRVVCDVFRQRDARPVPRQDEWVVVIDPGHGGRDPGVVSRKPALWEKDIVLDVSRRLAQILKPHEGIQVHLTRDRDVYLGLRERVDRAQSWGGDLFVSIHVNGCPEHSARGAEVFFLSQQGATNAASRELEALENSADASLDPQLGEIADLPFAVDLLQTDTILRSSLLAEVVLDALGKSQLAAARGVKQANFAVLRSCRLPSILIELGFISNPDDARRLASATHRQALAETIARGLLEYRTAYARHSAEPGGGNGTASHAGG